MIEAGGPSTESVLIQSVVPAPPGVVMLALHKVPRNAEGAQSEGRAKEGSQRSAAEDSIKAGGAARFVAGATAAEATRPRRRVRPRGCHPYARLGCS
jgi:predicted transcriptional regulator